MDKEIDSSSKFYKKDRPHLDYYAVANEGQANLLLLIGDSHALKLNYRFHQLYVDAVEGNRTAEFPTIVAMVRYGDDAT